MNELTTGEMNDKVHALSAMLLSLPTNGEPGDLVQISLLHEHNLINGMYARSIHIPAGTTLTGLKHTSDHLNIAIGDITVTTDDGVKRLTGVHVMETKAGMVRAGWAHADTIWISIMRTEYADLKDLSKIEDSIAEGTENLMTRRMLAAPEVKEKICQ